MTDRRAGAGDFDRIKPPDQRLLERREGSRLEADDADASGRAALFSAGSRPASSFTDDRALGLTAHCSRCGESTSLDVATALRSAFPLFLVAPWKQHSVFAVCPTCRRRAWLRIGAGAGVK